MKIPAFEVKRRLLIFVAGGIISAVVHYCIVLLTNGDAALEKGLMQGFFMGIMFSLIAPVPIWRWRKKKMKKLDQRFFKSENEPVQYESQAYWHNSDGIKTGKLFLTSDQLLFISTEDTQQQFLLTKVEELEPRAVKGFRSNSFLVQEGSRIFRFVVDHPEIWIQQISETKEITNKAG